MAEMTDEQFKQKVIDVLDEVGAHVASSEDIDQVDRITDDITLPGVELDSQGNVVRYVSAKMAIFKNYLDAVIAVFYGWFGHDDTEGVQKEWSDLKTDAVAATDAANTAVRNVETAIGNANAAASNANAAADHADTSRQQIEQNESTRQSQESTRQQNESTRQSQESTRQQNESTRQGQETARETRATSDHTRAEGDHTTATGDHTTAGTDHTRAEGDHTRAEQDHSRAETDHTRADNDHDASVQATEEASNVDAGLEGMTVTVTDRNGVSRSVNNNQPSGLQHKREHRFRDYAGPCLFQHRRDECRCRQRAARTVLYDSHHRPDICRQRPAVDEKLVVSHLGASFHLPL